MSTAPHENRDGPVRYEIRIQGRLDPRWATWFSGLTPAPGRDGTTILHGALADQAALHGVLQGLRDLGLPLLSVVSTNPDQTSAEPAAPTQ